MLAKVEGTVVGVSSFTNKKGNAFAVISLLQGGGQGSEAELTKVLANPDSVADVVIGKPLVKTAKIGIYQGKLSCFVVDGGNGKSAPKL